MKISELQSFKAAFWTFLIYLLLVHLIDKVKISAWKILKIDCKCHYCQ